jgi:hypothetical protein
MGLLLTREKTMKIANYFFAALGIIYLSSAPIETSFALDAAVGVDNDPCTCYLRCEPAETQMCDHWGSCKVREGGPKILDGKCLVFGQGGNIRESLAFEIAKSLEYYFDAYIEAGTGEGGLPDEGLLSRAQSARLTLREHREIQALVDHALDLILGFDTIPPSIETPLRQIPSFKGRGYPEAREFLEGVRDSIVKSVLSGDVDSIEAAVSKFWSNNPNFHPLHTGRCYPHGHVEPEYVWKNAADCQTDLVQKSVRGFISRIAARDEEYN